VRYICGYRLQYGGRLAQISNPETNDFLTTTLNSLWWQNNAVWIGLNDRQHEQHWQWDNGSYNVLCVSVRCQTPYI